MLKTFLGAKEGAEAVAYFRPETAQAMFVDFKMIQETSRKRVPFGIAQVGKAFRNEITPGNFIFRTREFEQMEVEYFVKESEWAKHFETWLHRAQGLARLLRRRPDAPALHEIEEADRAFYSKRTVDIEYQYPFGLKELYGLAYRGDYDLKCHQDKSGADLRYLDPETNEKYLPHVIEPSLGVDRTVLVVMLEAYHEEEAPTAEAGESAIRVVMKFPKALAPYKVAVLPLPRRKNSPSRPVSSPTASARSGRRLRRDPVHRQALPPPGRDWHALLRDLRLRHPEHQAVTVRDRDSMKQSA